MGPPAPPPIPSAVKGPAAPGSDLGAGYRLGKYEIIKRLAIGGMAEIFLARVEALPGFQKIVVIKRILPQLATQRDFIEMFLDEARIAATLQHPNLVQVYDVGIVDGNYFMSMEYLHGEDVRSIMKGLVKTERKLPLEHALNIIINVSAGMHYAHEKVGFDGQPLNIVHRDVTPQNIIVTFEGGVKLLDFGIAKASNRSGETRFGTLKGKVPYMSPEQCRSDNLDRRTDVFSLGIMLYELTLGRRLYRAKSEFEIMKRIVDGAVTAPTKVDPSYDPELERIVLKALAKDREQRYQSAAALQTDLEGFVRDQRMYVSSTALKQYMESLFGLQVEAWREAQAAGKTLGEHLQATTWTKETELGDTDLVELDAQQAYEAERGIFTMDAEEPEEDDGAEDGGLDLPPAPMESSLRTLGLPAMVVPRRRVAPILAGAAALVLAGGGVVLWRLQPTHAPTLAPPGEVVAARPTPRSPSPPTEPVAAKLADPSPSPSPPSPPESSPQIAIGIARVVSSPPGATLYLDGKKLDRQSPTTLDGIAAGPPHVLLAQLDGYKDAVEHFTLRPNQVASLDVRLHHDHHHEHHSSHDSSPVVAEAAPGTPSGFEPVKDPVVQPTGEGTLVVASSPWCNVAIDGAAKGQTPLSVKLPSGKHSVVLTNPEFNINRTLSVTIAPNETLRKKLDFAQ